MSPNRLIDFIFNWMSANEWRVTCIVIPLCLLVGAIAERMLP